MNRLTDWEKDALQEIWATLDGHVDRADFFSAAGVIEIHFSVLMRTDSARLIHVLRGLPTAVYDVNPWLHLLYETYKLIDLETSGFSDGAISQVLASLDTSPRDTEDAAAQLSRGLLVMVALRRREKYAEATRISGILMGLIRRMEISHPSSTGINGAMLQSAITHLEAGQLREAKDRLSDIYRIVSPRGNFAHDAAGKLAVIASMEGERSDGWIARADRATERVRWHKSTYEDLWSTAARLLRSIDRLDWTSYHDDNLAVSRETAPDAWWLIVFARARAALVLGNEPHAAREVRYFLDNDLHPTGERGLPRRQLEIVELDLRIRAGLPLAEPLTQEFAEDDPIERAVLARYYLHVGDIGRVLELTDIRHWPRGTHRRARVELLLVGLIGRRHDSDTNADELAGMLRMLEAEIAGDASAWNHVFAVFASGLDELHDWQLPPTVDALLRRTTGSTPAVRRRAAPLTPRERLVLQYLLSDHTIRQTAKALNVSEGTVRNQRKSAYRKLGAATRQQALAAATRAGVFDPSLPAPSSSAVASSAH